MTTKPQKIEGGKKIQNSLTFGRIVIDKKHQFFGKIDPIAFVIADIWSKEGEDETVFVDHYRGSFEWKYKDLRNEDSFEITDRFIDPTKPILEQLEITKEHL